MLEKLDLSKKVSKEEYNRQKDVFRLDTEKMNVWERRSAWRAMPKDRLSSCLRAGAVHAAVR